MSLFFKTYYIYNNGPASPKRHFYLRNKKRSLDIIFRWKKGCIYFWHTANKWQMRHKDLILFSCYFSFSPHSVKIWNCYKYLHIYKTPNFSSVHYLIGSRSCCFVFCKVRWRFQFFPWNISLIFDSREWKVNKQWGCFWRPFVLPLFLFALAVSHTTLF